MYTRRQAVILATATSLLTTDAFGQQETAKGLFDDASGKLREPARVRQLYGGFGYYVQLLEPSGRLSPDKVSDARKTYLLLGDTITRNKGMFDAENASAIRSTLEKEYAGHRTELFNFLQNVGIEPGKIGSQIIEVSISGMMLYQAAANRVREIEKLLFCCWPFCFGRPT